MEGQKTENAIESTDYGKHWHRISQSRCDFGFLKLQSKWHASQSKVKNTLNHQRSLGIQIKMCTSEKSNCHSHQTVPSMLGIDSKSKLDYCWFQSICETPKTSFHPELYAKLEIIQIGINNNLWNLPTFWHSIRIVCSMFMPVSTAVIVISLQMNELFPNFFFPGVGMVYIHENGMVAFIHSNFGKCVDSVESAQEETAQCFRSVYIRIEKQRMQRVCVIWKQNIYAIYRNITDT